MRFIECIVCDDLEKKRLSCASQENKNKMSIHFCFISSANNNGGLTGATTDVSEHCNLSSKATNHLA